MKHNPPSHTTSPCTEAMSNAVQTAAALRLPYYWFADPVMRDKYAIPHYLLGGLVRFRLSEISTWAERSSALRARKGTS